MRSSESMRDDWDQPPVPLTETDQELPQHRWPLDDYVADIGERTGGLMWSLARAQGG